MATIETAEVITVTKLNRDKPELTINLASSQVLVNGYWVASSFRDFKNFCAKWGFVQSDFKNWPFNENL